MTCNTLKFNLTPLSINLSFGIVEPSDTNLSFGMNEPLQIGVTDVQVEGNSIVDGAIAHLNLGQGLSFQNQELILTLNDTQEINPKNMTLNQQDGVKIYIEENGILKQVSLNNLDYNKIKVQEIEDLSAVNVGDFIFVKGV